MKIIFGLALDTPAWPLPAQTSGGIRYLGPQGFLQWLETHLGLASATSANDYLRIEQYRQALLAFLEIAPDAFYCAALQADQFATAEDMLSRRDELRQSGWDFQIHPNMPERLATFAQLEALLQQSDYSLSPGMADRFSRIRQIWSQRKFPLRELQVLEPRTILPAHWVQLFDAFAQAGFPVQYAAAPTPKPAVTDLDQFRNYLLQPSGGAAPKLRNDGSLIILRGQRETEMAAWTAALLRRNPQWQPAILVPEKSRVLNYAIIQEGLPSLGMQSATLARPSLQVLKLAPEFLWNPIDPYKIMEFVSLAIKPLEADLASRIALQMAQTPGLQSDTWHAMIQQYFRDLDQRAEQGEKDLDITLIRQEYRFWFERRRYDSSGEAPKEDMLDIFRYVQHWALRTLEHQTDPLPLARVAEQARQIVELLEALPEQTLNRLELERIVRTIYEPTPIQMRGAECGHYPYLYQGHALVAEIPELLWWTFTQYEADYFFSRWYQPEITWLQEHETLLDIPADQNARMSWQRKQPFLRTHQQLVLAIPAIAEGRAVMPHPLLGDLEACFGDLTGITLDLDQRSSWSTTLFRSLDIPRLNAVDPAPLARPVPFLELPNLDKLQDRESESFSSLERLLYYPYLWMFKYKVHLHKSPILSIVKDHTLLGNLAHRTFEFLLQQEGVIHWNQQQVDQWIDRETPSLFDREGAVLLLYGKEPERINFIKRLKFSAWSLLDLLQRNQWTIAATEYNLEGLLGDINLKGRADLVLQRGDEWAILDLKWRGNHRYEQAVKNEEDLQLILYAYLWQKNQNTDLPHTAYFILENGKMVLRNNAAFAKIPAVSPGSDHRETAQRMLEKIEKTLSWRTNQITRGQVEVRCTYTRRQLEDFYGSELLPLLEMKADDASFDDYQTLIGLIQ